MASRVPRVLVVVSKGEVVRVVSDGLVSVCVKDLDVLQPGDPDEWAAVVRDHNENLFKFPVELLPASELEKLSKVEE